MEKNSWVDCSVAGTREFIFALCNANGIYVNPWSDHKAYPHVIYYRDGKIKGYDGYTSNHVYPKVSLSTFIKFIEEYQPPLMLNGHKVEFDKEGIIKVGCNSFKTGEVDKFIAAYNKFFNK